MAKSPTSIREAQELLRKAVQENKDELVNSLRSIRSQLEDLVSVLGPAGLPKEIQKELDALTQVRNELAHGGRSSSYVKLAEKVDWMTEQLAQHGGEMPKVELLEAARGEWSGRNVSAQFLDRAIDEAFESRKEKDATVTVLLKGGTTD